MPIGGDAAAREPIVECAEVSVPEMPLSQGDVLEWLASSADPWKRYAIIVTADCDIAHSKHGGVLACVPILRYEEYLTLLPLASRLTSARMKLLERASKMIREEQAANRPEFTSPLSDNAISVWIEDESAKQIIRELRIKEEKTARRLENVLIAIRKCLDAETSAKFSDRLDAVAQAVLVTQGETDFAKRRAAIIREILDRLESLPGDAIFLHALGPAHRTGYVVYLRSVLSIDERAIARRVPDLRSSSVQAKRISRLTSPYVFHLSQQLGQIFSAIGLPSPYEDSRRAFIEDRLAQFGAV